MQCLLCTGAAAGLLRAVPHHRAGSERFLFCDPHCSCCRPILFVAQEKPLDFYEQFHVIVLGLDSLEARRYMNSVACSFLGEPLPPHATC